MLMLETTYQSFSNGVYSWRAAYMASFHFLRFQHSLGLFKKPNNIVNEY